MRITLSVLLLLLLPFLSFSQDNYEMSEPIDISPAGWNKVIQMKNGNTLIFHFENRKAIIVKVFDKNRKEIASAKTLTKVIDLNTLDRTYLDKLFEINGEATLFLTQEISNRETTVRLRFSSETGALTNEEIIFQSPSFKDRAHTFFIRQKNSDSYTMVCYHKPKLSETDADIKVITYNNIHGVVNELPVKWDNSKYDNIYFKQLSMDNTGGILMAFVLTKLVQDPGIKDQFLFLHYLPAGKQEFISKIIQLPQGIAGISVNIKYNEANKTNVIVMSDTKTGYFSEKDQRRIQLFDYSYIVVDQELNIHKMKLLDNRLLNEYVQSNVNSKYIFNAYLKDMQTTQTGATMITYIEKHPLLRPDKSEKLSRCNVAIASISENGEETWATILPKPILRYVNGTYPDVMGRQAEEEMVYTVCIKAKSKYHILFNDRDDHFDLKMDSYTDSLYRHQANFYSYDNTNAIHYSIDDNNQLSKNYLFGKPEEGEFWHIFVNTYDYDEDSNDYVTLLMKNKNKKNSIHLAWKQL